MFALEIATPQGKRTVKAHKTASEFLAAHRSPEDPFDIGNWTITHIPSGYSILRGIKTLERAKRAAALFATIPGWEALTPDKAHEFFTKNYEAMTGAHRIAYNYA